MNMPNFPSYPKAHLSKENKKIEPLMKKTRLKSDYSSNLFDLQRMDRLLTELDDFAFHVQAYDIRYVKAFYSGLYDLYRTIRPFIAGKEQSDWDKIFSIVKGKIFLNPYKIERKVFDYLTDMYTDLYQIRQEVGLGMTALAEMSQKKRLELGMGIKKT